MKFYDKINQIEKRKIAKKCTKVMDENFATNYLTDTQIENITKNIEINFLLW